jgi:hypothetical protein
MEFSVAKYSCHLAKVVVYLRSMHNIQVLRWQVQGVQRKGILYLNT